CGAGRRIMVDADSSRGRPVTIGAAAFAALAIGLALGPRAVAGGSPAVLCAAAVAAVAAAALWPCRIAISAFVAPQLRARSRMRVAARLILVGIAAALLWPVFDEPVPSPSWQYVDATGGRSPAAQRDRAAWGERRAAVSLHARVPDHPEWHSSLRLSLPDDVGTLDLWITQPPESVVRP